jgi:adenylate kinase
VNLVLLGPPGSGKGTQASRLSEAHRAPAIATGDILRAQREAGTRLGLQARRYLDSGELVPDRLVIEIIRHRLHEPDTEHGFILDGFPRTVAQAEALDRMLAELRRPIDLVLYLEIGREALMNRLGHRYICPTCGAVYSLSAAQVRGARTCSRDGAALDQRSDDRPDIIAHRIDVFLHQTAPLIDHYRGQGRLVLVEADRSADEVYAAMTRVLTPRSGVNSTA